MTVPPAEDGPVYVVVNPASGRGRGARLVQPVLDALRARGVAAEHGLTSRQGEEGEPAGRAAERGFRRIVAVGGDGTWGNVGDALVRAGATAALGLVAGGTGCDLAKSLGVPAQDVEAAVAVVAAGHTRAIDAGLVEDKHFFNVAGFGLDVAVIEDSWTVKWLRGDLLYLYCALRQLHDYRGFRVDVTADGEELGRLDLLMLMIANARIFGGKFPLAPQAVLDDGRLDLVAFGNMPWRRRLPLMGSLLRGTHLREREVQARQPSVLRLRFDAPPAYETDGEWNRARSAELEVTCRPAALRVLVPAR